MLEKLTAQQIVDGQGRPTKFMQSLDAKTKDELNALLGLANTVQVTPADPTGTTSTSAVMMGLAGSVTPIASGKIMIRVLGSVANSTSGDGSLVQIRYGTGTAPSNGAAAAGTAVGNSARFTAAAANQVAPFGCAAIVSGLIVGTAYWIDIAIRALTGGTASVRDLVILIEERP